jgi:hypothetical protein
VRRRESLEGVDEGLCHGRMGCIISTTPIVVSYERVRIRVLTICIVGVCETKSTRAVAVVGREPDTARVRRVAIVVVVVLSSGG